MLEIGDFTIQYASSGNSPAAEHFYPEKNGIETSLVSLEAEFFEILFEEKFL